MNTLICVIKVSLSVQGGCLILRWLFTLCLLGCPYVQLMWLQGCYITCDFTRMGQRGVLFITIDLSAFRVSTLALSGEAGPPCREYGRNLVLALRNG